MHADPFAGNSKLLVSSSRDALIRLLSASYRLFSFTYSIALSSSSLHPRAVRRDGINFCHLIFIAESLAASSSAAKFALVLVHGRKPRLALESARGKTIMARLTITI